MILGITGAMNTLQMIVAVELFGTKYIGSVLGVVLFFGTLGGALGTIRGGIYDTAVICQPSLPAPASELQYSSCRLYYCGW